MERSCGETGEKHQAAHREMEVLRATFLSSMASVPSVAYTEITDCPQQYSLVGLMLVTEPLHFSGGIPAFTPQWHRLLKIIQDQCSVMQIDKHTPQISRILWKRGESHPLWRTFLQEATRDLWLPTPPRSTNHSDQANEWEPCFLT